MKAMRSRSDGVRLGSGSPSNSGPMGFPSGPMLGVGLVVLGVGGFKGGLLKLWLVLSR